MAANITNLQKKVANCVSRQASVFFRKTTSGSPDTYAFHNAGRVHGGVINFEPVTDEPDSAGRDATLTFDVTGTFVMKQTSADEIAVVGDLSEPDDYDQNNGHTIFFSDRPQTETSVYDDDGSGVPNVDGFGFENILPKVTGEVNFSGDESMITVEFSCRITRTALDAFNETDGQLITVDA